MREKNRHNKSQKKYNSNKMKNENESLGLKRAPEKAVTMRLYRRSWDQIAC